MRFKENPLSDSWIPQFEFVFHFVNSREFPRQVMNFPIELFLLLLIQFGSFYIIGQFIQPYLRDWYGHQRERPCIRTEVEIVWNIIPSGSVALSVIKRGENVMNESHFNLFQPQFIDSFHCILISSQPSSVSWTYAQLTSSPVGLSWIEGWVRSSQRSGFYSLSIFKSFSSPG